MIKPIQLPLELKCDSLVAKALSLEINPELFAAIDESRLRLREYLYWVDYVKTEADELNSVKDLIAGREKGEHFVYVLFDAAQKLLGTIDVHEISYANHSAAIGYWLRDGETGKGYISKALQLLEAALFAAGLHRLVIKCVVENTASAAVAERNNYHFEGIALGEIYGYEKYWDCKVYAKLSPL